MNKAKSMLKRILTLAMALVLCATLITVPSTESQAATKSVKSITVKNLPAKTLTLKKGKSFKLKLKVTVTGGASKAVTYSSSNKKVATVNSKGKITAKKKGKATITITSKADSSKKLKIKVTVGKPVKKVKLSQTSATIITGKSLTLKATVTPKKASNKKVVWTSSDTSIATVSKKGVVKTLKAGTVKITATAKDGSGKKKVCTIKVIDPITISSLEVLNNYSLKVTLSDTWEFTAEDFTVKTKSTAGGSYLKELVIDSVSTTDNKTYTINFNTETGIYKNEYAQVTIATFGDTKETVYTKAATAYTYDSSVYAYEYGSTVRTSYYLMGSGYATATVTGLPAGIKASTIKNSGSSQYIRFYGTASTCGKTTATVTTTDELGNTYTDKITFIIYDSSHMYAFVAPTYYLIGAEEVSYSERVYVYGGDNNYTYELTGTTYDATMSGKYIYATFKAASTYTLTVKVTDGSGHSTTTPAVFNIKQGVTIAGMVTDSAGNGISDATIYYENTNLGDRYSPSGYAYTDSKGAYSLLVSSGTYDIRATYYDSVIYLYSQSLTSSRSGFDLKLPLYKVVLYSNNSNIAASDFGTWYNSEMDAVGYGDTLYLTAGTYSLKTLEATSGYYTYTAAVNLTVTNASVVKTATVSLTSQPTAIYVGSTPITIKAASKYYDNDDDVYYYVYNYSYYKYTASTSGYYKIQMSVSSVSNDYSYIYPCDGYYDCTSNYAYNYGNSNNGYCEYIVYMNAGETYYFKTHTRRTSAVSATITLSYIGTDYDY